MNSFATRIEGILIPILGEFPAKMTVKAQCKRIGITPESIGPQHLDELANYIRSALRFLGQGAVADGVEQKIKTMR